MIPTMLLGREHFYRDFNDAVLEIAGSGFVLDVGTTHRFCKEVAPFKDAFASYVALNYGADPSFGAEAVDIDGDIHRLPIRSASVDGVLCIEVIEHITDPENACRELHRILRKEGRLLLTTPFMQPFHGKEGDYDDFLRYTDAALKHFLRHFSKVTISPKGGLPYRLLMTLTPDWFQSFVVSNAIPMAILNWLDKRRPTRSPLGWIVLAEK